MVDHESLVGPRNVISPEGTSVPTSYWNLSGNPYNASFSQVSNRGVYTNYYFTSNNGSLTVKNIKLFGNNGSSIPCEIDLFDKTTGQKLYYTNFTTDTGTTYSINYTNLNPNDQYYLGIFSDAIDLLVDGQFTVSW
jgi:hypothetical protein